jgi:hypothetical protein
MRSMFATIFVAVFMFASLLGGTGCFLSGCSENQKNIINIVAKDAGMVVYAKMPPAKRPLVENICLTYDLICNMDNPDPAVVKKLLDDALGRVWITAGEYDLMMVQALLNDLVSVSGLNSTANKEKLQEWLFGVRSFCVGVDFAKQFNALPINTDIVK